MTDVVRVIERGEQGPLDAAAAAAAIQSEAARDDSITAQGLSETAQGLSETAQGLSETAQGLSEDARDSSITAQGLSETAQGLSETAQGLSETAQGLSEAARDSSITAQGLSEAARDASVIAQGLSEDAQAASEAALAAAIIAQNNGVIGFTDKATMDATLTFDDGTIALVTNDTTPANNGNYRKSGASGVGSWIQSSFDRVLLVENDVAAIVNSEELFQKTTKSGNYTSDPFDTENGNTTIKGIGIEPLHTGTTAAAATTWLFWSHQLKAGFLSKFSMWSVGSGTVKLKRFRKDSTNLEYIIGADLSLPVVAGLNEFIFDEGTLPEFLIEEGDSLGLYTPGSTLKYASPEAGGPEYGPVGGDLVADVAIPVSTKGPLPGTVRLMCYFEVTNFKSFIQDERVSGPLGEPFYMGPDDIATRSASWVQLPAGKSYIDYHKFQQDMILEEITINATGVIRFVLFVLSLTDDTTGYTVLSQSPIDGVDGVNVFTAGTDFPSNLIIPKGGMVGYYLIQGTIKTDNAVTDTRRRVILLTSPSLSTPTITPQDPLGLGGTENAEYMVEFKFKRQLPEVALQYISDRYIIDFDFSNGIPFHFVNRNASWSFSSGQLQSSSLGLANGCSWPQQMHFSNTIARFFLTPAASSEVAVIKRDLTGLGTACTIDLATNTIAFRNLLTSDTLPAIYSSKTCAFTLTAGNELRVDLIKGYKIMTLIVTDLVTNESDTLVVDGHSAGYGAGMMVGSPGIACIAGSVSFRRLQFVTESKRPKVIIFGDSIVEGTGATDDTNGWAYLTCDDVGGVTSGRGGHDFAEIWLRILVECRILSPEYVIILAGANDTVMATWTEVALRARAQLEEMGIIPIFCTTPWKDATPLGRTDINPYIKASGWKYIDFMAALTVDGDQVTKDPALFADDIHPNVAGHLAMYNRAILDLPELFD